jgi:hypothetical protein
MYWAAPSACFYVVTVFSLGYLTKTVGISNQTAFLCLTGANLVAILTTLIAGAASDRFGRKPPAIVASLVMLAVATLVPGTRSDSEARVLANQVDREIVRAIGAHWDRSSHAARPFSIALPIVQGVSRPSAGPTLTVGYDLVTPFGRSAFCDLGVVGAVVVRDDPSVRPDGAQQHARQRPRTGPRLQHLCAAIPVH